MTSQSKKTVTPVIEPVKAIEPAKTLLKTTYTIERRPYVFYMNIIELYTDGTWMKVGETINEPLPHLFNRIEALLMRGVKL